MVGAAETARYRYVDGKTNVTWEVGEKVDTAVWITVFIVLIALINLFPVKVGQNIRQEKSIFRWLTLTLNGLVFRYARVCRWERQNDIHHTSHCNDGYSQCDESYVEPSRFYTVDCLHPWTPANAEG